MAQPNHLDQHPGPMPSIRSVGNSVVFEFAQPGIKGARLIIRCDDAGQVFASIKSNGDANEQR